VNVRGWPGLTQWQPPRPARQPFRRLGDRVALVMHFAHLGGTSPGDGALGAYLLIAGPSVIEAGMVVPDHLDPGQVAFIHVWAAGTVADTLQGPHPWRICTLSQFFHPRTGIFVRTTYTGMGWCIGADLGRVLAMVAEHVTMRAEPHADMWELWLPGWGKVHDRGRIKRVSPHRPCLRLRARRAGWQVDYGPVNLKKGFGMVDGTTYRHGEFLDLLTAAYVLDADRGASYGEHRVNFDLTPMDLPLLVTPDSDGLNGLADVVQGMHAFSLVLAVQGATWFPSTGGRRE
jgi:hypothetical protein